LGGAVVATEVAQFHTQGYLGPYAACAVEEMTEFRDRIEREVLSTNGPNIRNRAQCRHLHSALIHKLCSLPAIVDRIRSLYGNDLLLWASYFFTKEPGALEIPWHQDLQKHPEKHLGSTTTIFTMTCPQGATPVRFFGREKKYLEIAMRKLG